MGPRNNAAATIHSVATKIPDRVAANCRKSPERMAWLVGLPAVVQELELRWELTPDAPLSGEEPSCSYVEAVRRPDGTPAVLKISMPHMEQEHETDGLRFWNADPTVRLIESDDELRAMLLERCHPGTTLRVLDECEQDIVISSLLRRLWRPLPTLHRFRPLSALIEYWSNETLAEVEQWPDGGLVREGLRVFKELPHTATTDVLLATDLHEIGPSVSLVRCSLIRILFVQGNLLRYVFGELWVNASRRRVQVSSDAILSGCVYAMEIDETVIMEDLGVISGVAARPTHVCG